MSNVVIKPFKTENSTHYFRVNFEQLKREEMYLRINAKLKGEPYQKRNLVFSFTQRF